MKTKINIVLAAMLFFASCTKENATTKNALPQQQQTVTLKPPTTFTLGESYHGGVIFYIDNTGKHGLIAATSDQGQGISWKSKKGGFVGSTSNAYGTGAANTAAIVAAYGAGGNYAAALCSKYVSGSFKNWYLPSKAELTILFQNSSFVPGLSSTNYWSSSEVNKLTAWDLGPGFEEKDRKTFTLYVRAISSF